MKHPVFARELKIGDMINGHCDGWLIIEDIQTNPFGKYKTITVTFTNGKKKTYSADDRIDAIRR